MSCRAGRWICHDVRKSMDEWERRQLLISRLDAFFGGGKHDSLVDSKVTITSDAGSSPHVASEVFQIIFDDHIFLIYYLHIS